MTFEADPGWKRFLPDSWPDPVLTSQHAGETVLITGAGGSIGGALARAIASAEPKRLILLDSSEGNLCTVADGLPTGICEAALGSVNDRGLVDELLKRHRPDMIYHAAAVKHVPFLEYNPFAAILSNTLGTRVLAESAVKHAVRALVLVSTDKAVRPHSVMGASKRVAEWIVMSLSTPRCSMSAIRLANVIGSSGSVVPAFLRQIEAGGPVTVTSDRAERWFLSIEQTVNALLSAGRAKLDRRVLVPDFGEPVNIADLARYLIGDRGIGIRYTGLRPGDKVREDQTWSDERMERSEEGLRIYHPTVPVQLERWMSELEDICATRDSVALLEWLSRALPDYTPSTVINGVTV